MHVSPSLQKFAVRRQHTYVERRFTSEPPTVALDAAGKPLPDDEFVYAPPVDTRTLERALLDQLKQTHTSETTPLLILAGGGMGKTELLLRLFRRAHRRFDFRQNLA